MKKNQDQGGTADGTVRYIDPPAAPPAQGLYSHAARVAAGDLYFIAGQLAVDAEGKVRAELFPKIFRTSHYPPNTICVIDRLVKEDFLLEVEAIARAK